MKTKRIKAWHFLPAMGKLSYNDPRPVVVGETLTHEGPLAICESGLHASRSILDALSFRHGTVLCRVECWGDVTEQDDKLVARNRKCLSMVDISPQLREFALRCAERVLPIFEAKFPNDDRPRRCIETTRAYLRGEATAQQVRDAADAAYAAYAAADAAHAAAYTAVHAAYAAVHAADAAYAADAAADAADAAADAAARAAARAADAAYAAHAQERKWQEETLLSLL